MVFCPQSAHLLQLQTSVVDCDLNGKSHLIFVNLKLVAVLRTMIHYFSFLLSFPLLSILNHVTICLVSLGLGKLTRQTLFCLLLVLYFGSVSSKSTDTSKSKQKIRQSEKKICTVMSIINKELPSCGH